MASKKSKAQRVPGTQKPSAAQKPSATQKTGAATDKASAVCQSCGKPIEGQCMKAFGKFWHPEHFICAKCKKPITAQFNVRDDQLYCKEDYSEMFLERCPKCNQPVTDEGLVAMDKTWHIDHFVCTKCGVQLARTETDGFYVESGQPYCRKDFQELFGVKCFGCKEYILDSALGAMGQKWHEKCLRCSKCNEPLSEAFFLIEEKPVCRKCANK